MPTHAEHKRRDNAEVRCKLESLSPEFSHMLARNTRRGVQLLDFTAPVCLKNQTYQARPHRLKLTLLFIARSDAEDGGNEGFGGRGR